MSSMKYPYRDLGVPFDRNFRNDLNANFDDIEHDIRMIGGEAAQQALEAAEEANTQAIYAQTSGDYANDKGDYAAQQGDYAKVQGDYAKSQGDAASLAVNNANNALAAANEAVNNANTAIENANIAIANANNAAASANDAAANANSAATNANNAADNANTQATNAQNAAQAANDAAQAANQAAANANEAADNANTAAQDIINNTRYIEPYNPNTTYYKNNIVSYNGSSFIAKQTTTGNTPIGDANDPYWGLLAQRGVDGQGAVNSVNGVLPDPNGNVTLNAGDVGAETPAGAQAKADRAETNAKTYTDQEVGALETTVTSHLADYVKHPAYAVASGSANAYSVTLNPAPTAYADGMAVTVKVNVDSTGPSTLNVNGLGAKPLKKANGNDVTNLKANGVYTFRYNASTGNFIIQGEGGSGNAQPSDVLLGKTFTNDQGEQVGTLVAYKAGDTLKGSQLIQNPANALARVIEITSFPGKIYSICESENYLFVGCHNGIYKVNKSDLQVVASNLSYTCTSTDGIQVVNGNVFVNIGPKIIWLRESDLTYIGEMTENVSPHKFFVDYVNNRIYSVVNASGTTVYCHKISDGTRLASRNTSYYYAKDLFVIGGSLYTLYETVLIKLPLDLSSHSDVFNSFGGNVIDCVAKANGMVYVSQNNSSHPFLIIDVFRYNASSYKSSGYIENSGNIPVFKMLQTDGDYLYGTYDNLGQAVIYKVGFDLEIKKSFSYSQRYIYQALAVDQDFVYFGGNDGTNTILAKFEKSGTYQIK